MVTAIKPHEAGGLSPNANGQKLIFHREWISHLNRYK